MDGMTGGTDGGNVQQGSNAAPQSTNQPVGGGNVATSSNEPQPVELDDNGLIKIKGSDKPLKVSDVRNFQSQWTKAAQRAKALEAELARERAERQRYEQNRQQQSGQQHNQVDPDAELVNTLKSLPYLSGDQAAQAISAITGQIRQRDSILLGALKQMEKMQKVLQTLHQTHSSSSFDGKINKWLEDGGYPKEAAQLAKEIYLAYEGDDLDNEFPNIFKQRWEDLNRIIEAQRQAKLNQNRKAPFVPGRGGQTGPSKPLQFKGNESAKEIAESLWKEFAETRT